MSYTTISFMFRYFFPSTVLIYVRSYVARQNNPIVPFFLQLWSEHGVARFLKMIRWLISVFKIVLNVEQLMYVCLNMFHI